MIQRIQSVYLLISTIFLVLSFFFPYLTFGDVESGNYVNLTICWVTYFGDVKANIESSYYTVSILVSIATLISFFTIFLYKNRLLQIKLLRANVLLQTLFYALVFYLKDSISMAPAELINDYEFNISISFVAVSIIMNLLAIKGIKYDEKLVKAADRIR